MAEKILELAANPEKRKKMGKYGRNRLEQKLAWQKQKISLIRLYSDLFPHSESPPM